MSMTKEQAASIFGTKADLARALGISKSAVSQWPEQLEERQINEVVGAAVRLGKQLPAYLAPAAAA